MMGFTMAGEFLAREIVDGHSLRVSSPQVTNREAVQESEQLRGGILATVVWIRGAGHEPVGSGQEDGIRRDPEQVLDERPVVRNVLQDIKRSCDFAVASRDFTDEAA